MYQLPDLAKLPKHQYSVTVELDAPIETCFAAAAEEKYMMKWVPNPISVVYDHSAAARPYGPGSSRLVTVKPGVSLTEVIFLSEAPRLCGYIIPRLGFGMDALLKNYQGRMRFEPISATRTRLTWDGYFDCPGVGRLFEPVFRRMFHNLISTMTNSMRSCF
jgi:Polyketide cyclase / dehydrase and lipid transport